MTPSSSEPPNAYEPTYCPRCGTKTDAKHVDGEDRTWCPSCDVVHWRAAVPVVGVAVVDEPDSPGAPARVLAFHHDRTGLWDVPSAHQELPESAPETAARELEEETGLAVDPAVLDVLNVTVKRHPLGRYNFSTTYRTSRARTTGTLEPETPEDDLEWFTIEEARAREAEFVPGVVSVLERAIDDCAVEDSASADRAVEDSASADRAVDDSASAGRAVDDSAAGDR